jgi:sirohydrochlorin cobaltochelatase
MQAVILIGHGSLRSASGTAMIRCAARLRARRLAPLTGAAFLNYSRPTLAETVARLYARGASRVLVQPYFLIDGVYVRHDLPALVAAVAAHYPGLPFTLAETLGSHPALVRLAAKRVQAACSAQPPTAGPRGLLLMAHGTPLVEANAPLAVVAAQVAAATGCTVHAVGYLDCNHPDISTALAGLAAAGVTQIVALPYFLHLGRNVREDLPALLAQARTARPPILQAHHLDYDPLLVEAVAGRVAAALAGTPVIPPIRRPLALAQEESLL